jgi:hypothetical protein
MICLKCGAQLCTGTAMDTPATGICHACARDMTTPPEARLAEIEKRLTALEKKRKEALREWEAERREMSE